MVTFSEWIFNQFPPRFKEEDTYKVSGRGLFERLLYSMGKEWDDNLIPSIENLYLQTDPTTCDSKFLNIISYFYGNPPNPLSYEDKYRILLSRITEVNKIKGTAASYVLFFKLIGLDVTVNEIEPLVIRYDSEGPVYDYGGIRYDSKCPKCSDYTLDIVDLENLYPEFGADPIDPEILKLLIRMIKYVEPINARLTGITYNGTGIHYAGSYSMGYSFGYERIT